MRLDFSPASVEIWSIKFETDLVFVWPESFPPKTTLYIYEIGNCCISLINFTEKQKKYHIRLRYTLHNTHRCAWNRTNANKHRKGMRFRQISIFQNANVQKTDKKKIYIEKRNIESQRDFFVVSCGLKMIVGVLDDTLYNVWLPAHHLNQSISYICMHCILT